MRLFFQRLWSAYKPFRRVLLGTFAFIALDKAIGLVAPYFSGKIIDAIIRGSSITYTFLFIGATVALVIAGVVINHARERHEIKNIDYEFPRHINRSTLERVLSFSLGQHISENSGIKQSVISRGQSALKNLALQTLYLVLPTTVEVILLIGVLMYFSTTIGLIALIGISICTGYVIYTNKRFSDDYSKLEKSYNRNAKFQGEVLRNVELVISNAQEDRAIRECDEDLAKTFDFGTEVALRFNNFALIRNLMIHTVRISVLSAGVYLVYNRTHTIGELVMLLAWSNQAVGNVFMIANLHRSIIQSYTSVAKYFEMLAIETDVKILPNPVRPDRFEGNIEFRNVTLRYKRRDEPLSDNDDEEEMPQSITNEVLPALNNVSFTILAGERVAIVGESGSGKSTLVQALLRALDPEEGQIVVDGHDLRVLDLKRFRESIGIVDQEVTLFDKSLRYNITYGLDNREKIIKDSELSHVAQMACIDRFFPRLENGFDTVIGERGVKLSGGEKQRVGIARALIKYPDILIFDEATSSLDSENESLIRESIEKASSGRTTIIIAHRFSTIKQVDKVIVLEAGQVAGIGTHAELAASCPPYQRLIQNQKI
jgi:ABC-type multidrug transport system fused ATPase/permease subunit